MKGFKKMQEARDITGLGLLLLVLSAIFIALSLFTGFGLYYLGPVCFLIGTLLFVLGRFLDAKATRDIDR